MSFPGADPPKPLDDTLYKLEQDEYEFLSSQTGIKDQGELKKHVLEVQKDIYKVCRIVTAANVLFTYGGLNLGSSLLVYSYIWLC